MVRLTRRLILWIVAGLVGLAVIGAAALVIAALAIDPNRLKPRIEQAFEQRTGRTLQLDGDLAWRFFPWIVIRSSGGRIGNPAGFDAPDGAGGFASWKGLRLGVELLPLFDREVIIDRILIDGLELTLARREDGAVNWRLPEDAARALDEADMGDAGVRRLRFAIAQVQLDGAHVTWRDDTGKQAWEAQDLALRFMVPGRARPEAFALQAITLKGRLGGTPLPKIVDVAFEASRLDFVAEPLQLSLPGWKGAFAGAALEGGIEAKLGGEDRRLDGRIAGRVESLREVLRAVGVELPATRDREVFGNVELDTSFSIDGGRIATESLNLRVDDTRVRGSLERTPIEDGVLRFALIADKLDVDRYLAPPDKAKPFALELGPLRQIKAVGELRVDEAHMGGATLRGMTVNVE